MKNTLNKFSLKTYFRILVSPKHYRRFIMFAVLPGLVSGIIVSEGCVKEEKSRESHAESQSARKPDEHGNDIEYLVTNCRPQLVKAYNQVNRSASKYHVVKVLERNTRIPGSSKMFTRLLILIEDSGMAADHAFSEPDKEGTEAGRLDFMLGKTFWVDSEGNATFDVQNPPPKTSLVGEWYVENKMPVVSFYGPGSLPILINLITQK